ncbi:putative RNA recognition motif domain, nucleotide-binding alpha-beta plait domain superfamily [Helianthus anomalus]
MFLFVNFESTEDATKAVEGLNGQKFDEKECFVGKAQKKNERELELKHKFVQSMKEAVDKSQGLNLYVKDLDDTVTDESLREYFAPFGTITSCKVCFSESTRDLYTNEVYELGVKFCFFYKQVMRDLNRTSKGSGFVAFSTSDEASRALMEMNGKMIVGKPLYVALAQRKEDRRE